MFDFYLHHNVYIAYAKLRRSPLLFQRDGRRTDRRLTRNNSRNTIVCVSAKNMLMFVLIVAYWIYAALMFWCNLCAKHPRIIFPDLIGKRSSFIVVVVVAIFKLHSERALTPTRNCNFPCINSQIVPAAAGGGGGGGELDD